MPTAAVSNRGDSARRHSRVDDCNSWTATDIMDVQMVERIATPDGSAGQSATYEYKIAGLRAN